MKRGGPIQRRTPLRASSSLARSNIRPKRATPRRRSVEPHGFAWHDVRLVIFVRCGGRCEACGVPITLETMEGHHRLTRRLGPDCPCNALALCSDCHHGDTVHGGPARAKELGRIISRHSTTAPAEEPVEIHGRGRATLTCAGDYLDAA